MTKHKEIEAKIVTLVAKQLELEPAALTTDAHFTQLGADHLAMIELVMRLEDLFNVEINDEDAHHITSVCTATEYIARRQNAQQ